MSASIPVFGERPKAVPTPKLRALVKFPGDVQATTGIEVTKANGIWTFETDWSNFGRLAAPPSSSSYVLTYDTATGAYVLVPYNTLGTGNFTITNSNPAITLNKLASGDISGINATTHGLLRWALQMSSGAPESGSDLGSDFVLYRSNDAQTVVTPAFAISRNNGNAYFTSELTANSAMNIRATPSGDANNLFCDENGTGVVAQFWDRSATMFVINWPGFPATANFQYSLSGKVNLGAGFGTRQGAAGPMTNGDNGKVNFDWPGAALESWIDSTHVGTVAFTSDYRMKKDVVDLPGTWETVKALRPIKYSIQDFTPPTEAAARAKAAGSKSYDPLVKADDRERWGFIAHELQETLVETAASGQKDAPDAIQSPNPWPVIAALTKALQEAMARIEVLEAAQ
jgi:hypothetical protein